MSKKVSNSLEKILEQIKHISAELSELRVYVKEARQEYREAERLRSAVTKMFGVARGRKSRVIESDGKDRKIDLTYEQYKHERQELTESGMSREEAFDKIRERYGNAKFLIGYEGAVRKYEERDNKKKKAEIEEQGKTYTSTEVREMLGISSQELAWLTMRNQIVKIGERGGQPYYRAAEVDKLAKD